MDETNYTSDLPLYKRTHWRRFKEIATELCSYENINTVDYNLDSIVCYSTIGNNLKGRNVSYTTSQGQSCWVSDNKYDIYEIPNNSNSNKFKFAGEYLFLAHNLDFGYWIFR